MANMVQPRVQQAPQQQQTPQQHDPIGWLRQLTPFASMMGFPQLGMATAAYDFLTTGKPGQNSLLGMLGVGQGQQGGQQGGQGNNPFIEQLLKTQGFNGPFGGMGGMGGGAQGAWNSPLNNPFQFDMTGGFA